MEEVDGNGRRRRALAGLVDDPKDARMTFGFHQQARASIDTVRSRRQPGASFADAVKTMRLVDTIRRNDVAGCPGL
jgi:hypothetical protein